ncbi:MAG: hypothetical protein ACYC99_18130 [Candidatus Geothermincolia bacterium]
MHWTTHVVTGAATGYLIGRPVPAALAGFASHLAMDTFPHHDPDSDIPYVVDSMAGLALLAFIAKSKRIRRADPRRASLWGAIGAGLPDLELLAKLVTSIEPDEYMYPTHNGRIAHRQMNMMYSGATQIALVVVTVGLALLKWRRLERGQA